MFIKFVVILVLLLASCRAEAEAEDTSVLPEGFVDASQRSTHTNNWAVLVDASRFWFNYGPLSSTEMHTFFIFKILYYLHVHVCTL